MFIRPHVLRVDSKSVWLPCGPQGSPGPRADAAVDLAATAEEMWVWPVNEEADWASVSTGKKRSDRGKIIAGVVVVVNWMFR